MAMVDPKVNVRVHKRKCYPVVFAMAFAVTFAAYPFMGTKRRAILLRNMAEFIFRHGMQVKTEAARNGV